MAGIILITSVSSILLLILIQPVDLRASKAEELIFAIDYSFFTLYLYPNRNNKGKKLKKGGKRKRQSLPKARRIYKSVRFLLSKSEITINDVNLTLNESNPARLATHSECLILFLHLILGKLSTMCKDIRYRNVYILTNDAPLFDITLNFRLYNLLLAMLIYLLSKKKVRRKFNV